MDEKKAVSYTSVKDVGASADRNARHRRKMEDAHQIVDKLGGNEYQGFFAIYDGHCGSDAAIWCKNHLHEILIEELKDLKDSDITPEKMREVFTTTFAKADEGMKGNINMAGACAVVALVRQLNLENDVRKRYLFVANVGDSRAVLSRKGVATRLTVDHNLDDEQEKQRIIASGGFINGGRVNGMIVVTRSLGDHNMKDYLSNVPHVAAVELTPDDDVLVLACDGVWDVIQDQEAIDLIKNETAAERMSRILMVKALQGGSTDNISVMVIKL
jgi:serine/threonine protein phosphatase PrpC